MRLTPEQVTGLLDIIDRNQCLIIGREFGPEFLTDRDKVLLRNYGVNPDAMYQSVNDTVFTSFHFGMLSDALEQLGVVEQITFDHLKQYVSEGNYIPLTTREIATINYIKTQNLSSLRGVGGKIFQDINGVLEDSSREGQEDFLREEVAEGTRKKQTVRQIANEIAHKTGDWSRNFDRIVEYMSQSAFEAGKAAAIERNSGSDALVYKQVMTGACKHCIRLYTTKGIGSKPILFTLAQLRANGTNMGRKVADWKATIDSTHPFCRCQLRYAPKGYAYNEKTNRFDKPTEDERLILKHPRTKVRAIIGGHEVWV